MGGRPNKYIYIAFILIRHMEEYLGNKLLEYSWRIIPGLGYVVNNHADRKSPKDRGVGPLPYMAMKMAEINGGDPITTETSVLGAHPPSKEYPSSLFPKYSSICRMYKPYIVGTWCYKFTVIPQGYPHFPCEYPQPHMIFFRGISTRF